MTVFAGQSRDALRDMYVEAWNKSIDGRPLTALEAMIADVVGLHREYQSLLSDSQRAQSFAADASGGADNPFLHMGLHLAIREQVATDRPPGIRALHTRLTARSADAHEAEHRLMQVLAQTLWEAQRSSSAPDEAAYIAAVRRLLAG